MTRQHQVEAEEQLIQNAPEFQSVVLEMILTHLSIKNREKKTSPSSMNRFGSYLVTQGLR